MANSQKPYPFDWHIVNSTMHPLTKTSPWFRMQIHDKSVLIVQLLLKHRHNEAIRLHLSTATKKKELLSNIERVTIRITTAIGVETIFNDIVPTMFDELICFDLDDNQLSFALLSNGYKDSFRIRFLFYRSSTSDDRKSPPPITYSVPSETPLFAPNPQPTALLRQLNNLLVEQIDCDVHFDCQGVRIGAHRTILQMRSAFFRDLLLKHKDQSLHHFMHIDVPTLADTLQFLYTATVPRITITAEQLLSVSNIMELPELHELAQKHLLQEHGMHLVPSDAESIAKLLDLFEVERLQTQVATFIRTHLDELLANSHFEQELKERPDVCYKLLGFIHGSEKAQEE